MINALTQPYHRCFVPEPLRSGARIANDNPLRCLYKVSFSLQPLLLIAGWGSPRKTAALYGRVSAAAAEATPGRKAERVSAQKRFRVVLSYPAQAVAAECELSQLTSKVAWFMLIHRTTLTKVEGMEYEE